MVNHYIKIAVRHFRKFKGFSAINIAGVALGMAVCLLILQYVSFHLSFDQFHKNINRIYRVVNDRYQHGKLIQHGTITYSAIGKAMNDDYDEVVQNTRVVPSGETIITFQDKKISEEDLLYADRSFLSVFDFPLLAGERRTALGDPFSVILSESLAEKIFGVSGNKLSGFIGEMLMLNNNSHPFKVTAICKNIPGNSHLRFNMLISYRTLISSGWTDADYDFTDSDFWHYVQLKPGADYRALNAVLPAFSQKHFDGNKISGSDETFYLQPLSRAHLYSDFEYEIGETANATVVWGLLLIAVFIITIAWVNYINLTTARSVERAREVGIRKVMGGVRKQLISQFLTESLLVNLISLAMAIFLVIGVQHNFNKLVGYDLSLSFIFSKGLGGYAIISGLILLFTAGMMLSGFYPALVLSSFKPVSLLKGRFSSSKKGILFRKALVIGQFSITVALITGSIIVIRQIKFMNSSDLGFNMDQVLIVKPPMLTEWDSTFISRTNSFKEELKQLAHVRGAATSWNVPGGDIGRSFNVRRADSLGSGRFTMRHNGIDYDFISVYGINLIAGRNFTPVDHHPSFDHLRNAMINRSAARLLGFSSPEDAVGKDIFRGDKIWTVVGVTEDYHQKSLQYPMEPMIFLPAYSTQSAISVKITPGDFPVTMSMIKKKYETFFPGNLFDYTFLDERFNRQYENERLFSKAFGIFAFLAVFVACLGLFGLAMYSTIQRTKEIGIRKVLGASVADILILVSKDFVKLVILASVISFPVAWWVMSRWLDDFAYRIQISWWMFAVTGLMAILFAIATVSVQAIRAAISNPVKSLRTE